VIEARSLLDARSTFLVGDCIEAMRSMPANSVDCVVTSPPYWGLRDYGVAGQIGLEPTLGEHLDVMVSVFREVWRVLKPRGTLWLN
jgi:DNA modification methylase